MISSSLAAVDAHLRGHGVVCDEMGHQAVDYRVDIAAIATPGVVVGENGGTSGEIVGIVVVDVESVATTAKLVGIPGARLKSDQHSVCDEKTHVPSCIHLS